MKSFRVFYRVNTYKKYWVGMNSALNQGGGISRHMEQGADHSSVVHAESADEAKGMIVAMVRHEWPDTSDKEYEAEILDCREEGQG